MDPLGQHEVSSFSRRQPLTVLTTDAEPIVVGILLEESLYQSRFADTRRSTQDNGFRRLGRRGRGGRRGHAAFG